MLLVFKILHLKMRNLYGFFRAKILAVDSSCQSDLVRDGSQKYFVSVLQVT